MLFPTARKNANSLVYVAGMLCACGGNKTEPPGGGASTGAQASTDTDREPTPTVTNGTQPSPTDSSSGTPDPNSSGTSESRGGSGGADETTAGGVVVGCFDEDCHFQGSCAGTFCNTGSPHIPNGKCWSPQEDCPDPKTYQQLTVQTSCGEEDDCYDKADDALMEINNGPDVSIMNFQAGAIYPVSGMKVIPDGAMVVLRSSDENSKATLLHSGGDDVTSMFSLGAGSTLVLYNLQVDGSRSSSPVQNVVRGGDASGARLVADRTVMIGYSQVGISGVEQVILYNVVVASPLLNSRAVSLSSDHRLLAVNSTLVGGLRRTCPELYGCIFSWSNDRSHESEFYLFNDILVPAVNAESNTPTAVGMVGLLPGNSASYSNVMFATQMNSALTDDGHVGIPGSPASYFVGVPTSVNSDTVDDYHVSAGNVLHCLPPGGPIVVYPDDDIDGEDRLCQGAGADAGGCAAMCSVQVTIDDLIRVARTNPGLVPNVEILRRRAQSRK